MSDIELYKNSPYDYEELQLQRPDYSHSLVIMEELAEKYLNQKEIIIADFCCGTGKNTALLSKKININKAILIDINKDFIEIAKERKDVIKTKIVPIISDILTTPLSCECDAVISMFAYHHINNLNKEKYIEQIKKALKKNGVLILGEIYIKDKLDTLNYYKKLLNEIGVNSKKELLEKFLTQTAESDNFEFKVSKKFAHKQLSRSGFELLTSVKIWPNDKELDIDTGMYVEAWKLSN